MALDELQHVRRQFHRLQDRQTDARVLLDRLALFRRQLARLQQYLVADPDLSDVVQVTADLKLRKQALVQPKLAAQHHRELANTHRVTHRVRIPRVYCAGKRSYRAQVLALEPRRHIVE